MLHHPKSVVQPVRVTSPRRTREEAERALNTMNGTFLGHRRIRCGWAQHKQDTSSCNFGCIDRADPTNANVYVGNVAADVRPPAPSFEPLAGKTGSE